MAVYSELATMAGVSLSHISLMMRGKRQPSVEVARKLARGLGVTVDELLEALARPKARRRAGHTRRTT